MASSRSPTVKDVASHLRSIFADTGASSSDPPRFPNHAPSAETTTLLDGYLVALPAEPSSSSGNHSHHQFDEAREKEARTLRDALLDCWNAITPWRKVPKTGKETPSKSTPGGLADDSSISAFLVILSILYTADPSPLLPSDIVKVWWQWCLRPLIEPRTAPKLPERQPSVEAAQSKAFAFAGASRRGRSTSLSRTTAAPPLTTPPISTPTAPLAYPTSPQASSSSAPQKRSSFTQIRLSRTASASLTNLLVKGTTAPGDSGPKMVTALWDGFVAVDIKPSDSSGRGRKTKAAEVFESALVRWAKTEPKAFFERVSQAIGPAGKGSKTTQSLAALTLLTSFVRSFPQMSHHMLSTSLLASLIWVVVSPWSATASPPTSRAAAGKTEEAEKEEEKDPEGEKAVATLVIAALAMILPRIPTSVEPYLNSIFVAFARAACWEAEEAEIDLMKPPVVEAPPPIAQWDNEDFVGPYGIPIERTASGPGAPPPAAQTGSARASRATSPSRTARSSPKPHPQDLTAPPRKPPLLPSDAKEKEEGAGGLPFLTSATELFTVLYGLFPCNFIDFLRDPRGYLDGQGWSGRMLMDSMRLRMAILPMLRLHTLSPALLQTGAVLERKDQRTRLSALETADLIAEYERNLVVPRLGGASSLLAEYAGIFRPRPDGDDASGTAEGPGRDDSQQLTGTDGGDDESSHNGIAASSRYPSAVRTFDAGSHSASPLGSRGRRPNLDPPKSILATYVALKAAARTPSMSVSRSRGGSHGSKDPPITLSRRSSAHSGGAAAEGFRGRRGALGQVEEEEETAESEVIEQLVRENLMLKNELNFELYLKGQHLQQMGTLHKEHVRESGLEAEVQNLQTVNRTLRRKLELSSRRSEEMREAHAVRKANHVSYTESLKDRSAKYRDEKKAWIEEKARLKARVEDQEEKLATSAKELEAIGKRALDLEYELKTLQPRLASIDNLEQKNKDLTKALLVWDDDLRRFREQKRQMDTLTAEWKKAEMLSESGQKENDELRAALRAEEETSRKLRAELSAQRARHTALDGMAERARSHPPGSASSLKKRAPLDTPENGCHPSTAAIDS